MKILITGGAGFIASHIADRYIELGHEVAVVDDLSTGKAENLNPAAEFRRMSIMAPEFGDLIRSGGFDAISHHAAQVSVAVSARDPILDARINILGSISLLTAAVDAGVGKVIFASSGGTVYGEAENPPVAEDAPLRALSPYGISKATVERYIEYYAHASDKLKRAVLRYGNVYGPRQDPHGEAGVVAIFARAMLSGKTPTIFGGGVCVRDYIYIDDVVRANVLALEDSVDGVYNIGTGIGADVNDIYGNLGRIIGFDKPAEQGPYRAGDLKCIYIDPGKAERELGFRPEVEFDEGLRRTVEYFRANE